MYITTVKAHTKYRGNKSYKTKEHIRTIRSKKPKVNKLKYSKTIKLRKLTAKQITMYLTEYAVVLKKDKLEEDSKIVVSIIAQVNKVIEE